MGIFPGVKMKGIIIRNHRSIMFNRKFKNAIFNSEIKIRVLSVVGFAPADIFELVVEPTHLKNESSNSTISPSRVEKKTKIYLSCHHPVFYQGVITDVSDVSNVWNGTPRSSNSEGSRRTERKLDTMIHVVKRLGWCGVPPWCANSKTYSK